MSKSMNKILCRLFSTKKNELVLVFLNANLGWQYGVFQRHLLPNGDINEVYLLNASRMNVLSDVEDILKGLNPKTVKPFPNVAACPIITIGRTILAADCSLMLLHDNKLNCAVADENEKDVNGKTLREFLTDAFGVPDMNTGDNVLNIDLLDMSAYNTKVCSLLESNDIVSHNPASLLTEEESYRFICKHDADLSSSIEGTKSWASIRRELDYVNKVKPFKLIMLKGGKGVGKTTQAEHISSYYGIPRVSLTGDPSLTVEDICGYVIPNNDIEDEDDLRQKLRDTYESMLSKGGLSADEIEAEFDKIIEKFKSSSSPWKTQESDFLRAYTSGWLIIINEVNNFSNAVLIALNDAFYGANRALRYQGKTIPCHPKTIVVCTSNFGYQGNNPMNEAFEDRFVTFLMTDLVDDQYGTFLAKKYPEFDSQAVKEYVKFMFKLMDYMEKTFENQDRFSPSTPNLSTRKISEVMVHALAQQSFRQALGDAIYSATHGVEDNKVKTQGVITYFDKDITTIEQMFFMNKQLFKDAKKAFKDGLSIGVLSAPLTATNSTDIKSAFDKAASIDTSTVSASMDGLANIGW